MTPPTEITLYTRANCLLCDKAKAAIRAAESLYRLNIQLHEVDVDGDPETQARFTDDVPVIYVAGAEAFRHRVEPRELAALIRGGARAVSTLASESCVPCRGGVSPLAGTDLRDLQRQLGNGWNVVADHHLAKDFQFPDFKEALAFTNRIGAIAEEQGHHPDIQLGWGRVQVEIWTHAINGLTRSDFVLAARIDASSLA